MTSDPTDNRFDIVDLDESDPDAVMHWIREFCRNTPRDHIEQQYGRAESDSELATRISQTFPKGTQDSAYKGSLEGLQMSDLR